MKKGRALKGNKRAAKDKLGSYNPYLDVLRGVAILLVVIGHSIESYAPNGNFDGNIIFRIIYSFHMPLFMFLSGAAASYSSKPMDFVFIKKKFYALVVPFISWGLLSFYINNNYLHMSLWTHIKRIAVAPDFGLWFLWVLFLNFCALALMKYLSRWLNLYSYLVVWLTLFIIPTGKYGVGHMRWHLPFVVAGYLIYVYQQKLQRYKRAILAVCVVAFPLLAMGWHRLTVPGYVDGFEARLIAHDLARLEIGSLITIHINQWATLLYKYIVPFTGIGFVYWFFNLGFQKRLYPFFAFIGLYTLDIYVTHIYFLKYTYGSSWWAMAITGAISGLLYSFVLGYVVLRNVDILNRLFLGGRTVSGRKAAVKQ